MLAGCLAEKTARQLEVLTDCDNIADNAEGAKMEACTLHQGTTPEERNTNGHTLLELASIEAQTSTTTRRMMGQQGVEGALAFKVAWGFVAWGKEKPHWGDIRS